MLEAIVSRFIERERLLEPKQTIVIGVSGGSDSLALLYYLWKKAQRESYYLIVAHMDHMFRGEASIADADFVQETCQRLGVPCEKVQVDVPAMIAAGTNPQQAARNARYAFYQQVMEKYQADKLALGHHQDDQTENMLMYLTRGVSQNASIAIPVRRPFATGEIIRPFLAVSKEEIRDFCTLMQLQPREDASNEKEMYARNRFRKYLLPLLKEENPQVLAHFQQFAERLQADEQYLQASARMEMPKLDLRKEIAGYSISFHALQKLASPLQRKVLPLILDYLKKLEDFSPSNVHLDKILTMLEGSCTPLTIQLTESLWVIRAFQRLFFYFDSQLVSEYEMELNVPGVTLLPNGGQIVATFQSEFSYEDDPNLFLIAATRIPLTVRNKRAGDKVRMPQQLGHKKVKKSFSEHKLPLYLRDIWPVILSGTEIVWVPGMQKGDVSDNIQNRARFIKLQFQVGGAACGNS